ncbi:MULTISPECIES: hypothetical protein [Saccharothrix]|uniref:hypothetical protein n=1 Tax=Saccharothrix TaxID=2071 RepID=UPI00093B7FC2|nr:hypothetical protein [Saccharothrix sp. CB00851]OKI38692.1 hypothetical protein A6A25_00235 [Saccharothrix sp. CB00851]
MADFLRPLEEAVSVLDGYTKLLVLGKQGSYRKGRTYSWALNGDAGLAIRGVGTFFADMHFAVIDADQQHYEKLYRVTTLGYRYELEDTDGKTQWRMHWHPNGRSPVDYPHMHTLPDLKAHKPTARVTFEKAVLWCIASGAPLCCEVEEAMQILEVTESLHRLHRSWSERPGEPRG